MQPPTPTGFAEIVSDDFPLIALYHLFVRRDLPIFILRARQNSVAGREYARPNTGASITRVSSGNGVLPTRDWNGAKTTKQKAAAPVKRDG